MRRVIRRARLVLAVSSLALATAWSSASIRASAKVFQVPAHPDDRTIAHVLNRIGFGPAPGDIARVRAVGLDAYIEPQLHPERIADSGLAPRLSGLSTVSRRTRELARSYFLPEQMARLQQQRQRAADGRAAPAETDGGAAAMSDRAPAAALRGARVVLLELSQHQILRVTYSERQLEEVNIRQVVRTIIKSPEFFASASYRTKVKSPFEFVVSALRATRADVENALPLVQSLRELGMPLDLCQPPTGYGDKAEAWVNTGALLNRMNFAVVLTGGRMRGVRLDTVGATTGSATAALTGQVLAGDISSTTAATAGRATAADQAMALLIGSPDFQNR